MLHTSVEYHTWFASLLSRSLTLRWARYIHIPPRQSEQHVGHAVATVLEQ